MGPRSCSTDWSTTAGTIDELIAEHLEQCRRCGLRADTYRAIKKALRARPRRGS